MANHIEHALTNLESAIGFDNYKKLFTYIISLQCSLTGATLTIVRPNITAIMDLVPSSLADVRLDVESHIMMLEEECGFAEIERVWVSDEDTRDLPAISGDEVA